MSVCYGCGCKWNLVGLVYLGEADLWVWLDLCLYSMAMAMHTGYNWLLIFYSPRSA